MTIATAVVPREAAPRERYSRTREVAPAQSDLYLWSLARKLQERGEQDSWFLGRRLSGAEISGAVNQFRAALSLRPDKKTGARVPLQLGEEVAEFTQEQVVNAFRRLQLLITEETREKSYVLVPKCASLAPTPPSFSWDGVRRIAAGIAEAVWGQPLRRGEKKVVFREDLEREVASSFLKNGSWDLGALRQQIERDMIVCDVRLNGKRITDSATLCKRLGLAKDFLEGEKRDDKLDPKEKEVVWLMAMLQQGTCAECIKSFLESRSDDRKPVQVSLSPERRKVHELIYTAIKKRTELEAKVGEVELNPLMARYLRSAIEEGLLPPDLFDETKLSSYDKLPVYPTRLYAEYDPGQPVGSRGSLEVEQEMRLLKPEEEEGPSLLLEGIVQLGQSAQIQWGLA